MDIKIKLSTLWIVVMLNIIFADILSIMMELVLQDTIDIIGSDIAVTMAVAAIITNIPMLMVYFSRILPYRTNRPINIFAAALTIIYVIGGGSLTPHYIVIASIEVVLLIIIISSALKWRSIIEN